VLEATQVGEGLTSDEGVLLGVASDRGRFGALRLGGAARLRSGTVLYQGARIGDRFQTGHNVVVREETVIGDDVSVWSNSVIDYGCLVRDGVKIHCNCYVAQFTEIEEGAFLGPGVVLTNDLYPGQEDSAAALSGPLVGAHAHIGGNVTVLPFVSIGAGALVGAGSVVTRDVPAGTVAYGCPAVPVRAVEDLPPISRRVERTRVSPAGPGRRFRARGGAA
jgi:acetyltransferase-like isoleucine patch superfamily enzyme